MKRPRRLRRGRKQTEAWGDLGSGGERLAPGSVEIIEARLSGELPLWAQGVMGTLGEAEEMSSIAPKTGFFKSDAIGAAELAEHAVLGRADVEPPEIDTGPPAAWKLVLVAFEKRDAGGDALASDHEAQLVVRRIKS